MKCYHEWAGSWTSFIYNRIETLAEIIFGKAVLYFLFVLILWKKKMLSVNQMLDMLHFYVMCVRHVN